MRNLLIILSFILVNNCLFATGDSLRYLTPQDTVLLEINSRGQKLFSHKLEKGQTLYSLSSFYGLTLDMLFDYNPQLRNKIIHPGTNIIVPIPNKSIIRVLKQGFDPSTLAPVCYKVKKGDTMFGVANRSFRIPVELLMKKNNLTSTTLKVGQKLEIGWMKTESVDKSWQFPAGPPTELSVENKKNKAYFLSKSYKGETSFQKGKAQWNDNDNFSLKGLYCMHSTAPAGSIVRIENPITKNVTYAKVVGKIPLNYEKWVVVVVSKDVAKALKAIDGQFFVSVEYLTN